LNGIQSPRVSLCIQVAFLPKLECSTAGNLTDHDMSILRAYAFKVDEHLTDEAFTKIPYAFPKELVPTVKVCRARLQALSGFKPVRYDCCVNSCCCFVGEHKGPHVMSILRSRSIYYGSQRQEENHVKCLITFHSPPASSPCSLIPTKHKKCSIEHSCMNILRETSWMFSTLTFTADYWERGWLSMGLALHTNISPIHVILHLVSPLMVSAHLGGDKLLHGHLSFLTTISPLKSDFTLTTELTLAQYRGQTNPRTSILTFGPLSRNSCACSMVYEHLMFSPMSSSCCELIYSLSSVDIRPCPW